jgi:hypothetical protein
MPDTKIVHPDDVLLVKEIREVVRKYGYQTDEDHISLTAPIFYENTKKTAARFSWKLEISKIRDDPFAVAQLTNPPF